MIFIKNSINRIAKPYFDSKLLTGLISVKRYQQLSKLFLRTTWVVGGRISKLNGHTSVCFAKKIISITKSQGLPGLVLFLKTATVVTQQALGGYKITDSMKVGFRLSRSKSGFPRFLSPIVRMKLLQRDKFTVRWILTLFSLYRVIEFPGKIKISTITQPFNGSGYANTFRYIPNFFKVFIKNTFEFGACRAEAFIVRTATANTVGKSSLAIDWQSLVNALHSLGLNPSVFRSLWAITKMYPVSNKPQYRDLLRWNPLTSVANWFLDKVFKDTQYEIPNTPLGKLAIKEEPAGKVRVFAMPDIFTQWALKPIHDFIFNKILRSKITDGTFNQTGPLSRVPFGKVPIYSFDLSAATDRLPIDLQAAIISTFTNSVFAKEWINLLVGREWKTPDRKQLLDKNIQCPNDYPSFVKYAIGQPMGAYSSWAMLALTHHYILQSCAWSTGVCPKNRVFTEYAVLGDDIVIWNKRVASQYLITLKGLGVEVGIHKSLISPKGRALEFAKRTFVDGTDYSPVSFKEMSVAMERLTNLVPFLIKNDMNGLSALRFLGYGYRVGPDKINNRIVRLMKIQSLIPTSVKSLLDIYQVFLSKAGKSKS